MIELLGHSGDFALFGDGAYDGLTVIVNGKTLDTFDPQPYAGIDPTRWEEPDEGRVPTECYELAEQVLANAKPVTGTDVIIAAGSADKRSFAIPKTVQAEAQKALEWRKEHKRGGTDVGMNTARTLARGGSIGIQKVRHINRYFARHEVDKSGTGWSPGDDGYPSNGKIAWALWGGDSAWKWTNGILRREKSLALLSAAEEDQDTPPAPPEVTDPEQDAPVPEMNDEDEFTADELDGQTYAPDQPHPYLPDHRLGYLCEVCLGNETSPIHQPEDAIVAAAGHAVPADVRLDPRNVPSEISARAKNRLSTADQFFAFDVDEDQVPDFYVGVELRADGTPSMVTSIFMRAGEQWQEWNPKSGNWATAGEQDDAFPIDDEAAYAAALLMADTADPVPASQVNPAEWALVDTARKAIPDYEESALEELQFCVVFGDSSCKDCDDLVVEELWLRTPDDECWYWNSIDVEWQPKQSCPSECTSVDLDAAREIAARLMREAHATMQQQANQNKGTFQPKPGGGDQAIGPHLSRPHGSVLPRPSVGTPPVFEFDSAFSRAAWVVGTSGDSAGFMSPTATHTSFATLVDEYTNLAASDGYTSEERSKNASKQFRDALGRFARSGDTVHVKGGRTGKVKDYDEKSDRVKIQYDDNSEQDIDRSQVTRIGSDKDDEGSESRPKRIDVSKIKAEPRATSTTPKAWLDKLLPPMDREALDTVISNYQEFIERERRRKLESFARLDPDTTDVRPLYLAQVDPVDNQAVLDLIALVPSTKKSTDLRAFVRRNGRWELDAKMLQKIKSVTPPALVVLDESTFEAVKEQVDSYFKEKEAKGEDVTSILRSITASAGSQLWDEYGTLLPVAALGSLDTSESDSEIAEALTAAGVPGIADTPSDIAAARRLRRYWLRGPGAAKIMWNTPGDWTRCVKHLAKYMGPRAKGYCQNLHKAATGVYTGSKFNVGRKRRGLRADGSALLLALPTKILGAPGDLAADGIEDFPALAELQLPTVDDLKHLTYRDDGHVLRVGERFLVNGDDGAYVVAVLDPAQTLGWSGEPAIICGEVLLREKTEAVL